MKRWATLIHAKDPKDGRLKLFGGPSIFAPSKQLAEEYCQNNGLGYCWVEAQLLAEIPLDENNNPDFDNAIDYETINNN